MDKKDDMHTEQAMMFDILLSILEEKDNLKNARSGIEKIEDEMNNKILKKNAKNLEIEQSSSKPKFKRANTNLQTSKHTKKKNEFQLNLDEAEKEQHLMDQVSDTIFIYVMASPCLDCFNKYQKIIQMFKNLKIKVFYSKEFKYKTNTFLNINNIENDEIYIKCKNWYSKGEPNWDELIKIRKCINTEVITAIKNEINPHLSFQRIYLKKNWKFRMLNLFKLFDVKSD